MKKDKPKLIGALTCDQVITDKNDKHTLVGLFSNINANKFPAVYPQMVVFCAWLNKHVDETYKLRVNIKTPEGNETAKIEGQIKFKKDKLITYGIFNFNGLVFEKDGDYKVGVYLDDENIVAVPIRVGISQTDPYQKK